MRNLLTLVLLLGLCAGACTSKSRSAERKLRVAAASDLARAFAEVSGEFKAKTGITVEVEYGSSGLLAKQIEQGAPFDLYAAANRSFVDQVVKAGKCDGNTAQLYARGRLVVWTPNGVAPPKTLQELSDPRFKKIAIANPEHAPYGRAAKQALEASGVWPQVQDRIVLGENISTTMMYAQKQEVEVALIALSLAVVATDGASLPVDSSLHTPLDQAMVVCGAGEQAALAKQYADFVGSKDGREIMTRYGFVLPGESTAPSAHAPPAPPPAKTP